MSLASYIKTCLRSLKRFKSPIRFGDLARIEPVSAVFGLDRGTPIDRYYIEKFIAANRDAISGCSLEVGEIKYLKRFGAGASHKCILVPKSEIARLEVDVDEIVVGDLTVMDSLPAGRFDAFVCTQTLNFIYDVKAAICGAHHLLRNGGIFIGTVAGISQISRYDMDRWGDYWRFTTLSLERLISDVFGQDVKVESFGNALSAQLGLQGVVVEDLPDSSLLDRWDRDYQVIIGFCVRKAK